MEIHGTLRTLLPVSDNVSFAPSFRSFRHIPGVPKSGRTASFFETSATGWKTIIPLSRQRAAKRTCVRSALGKADRSCHHHYANPSNALSSTTTRRPFGRLGCEPNDQFAPGWHPSSGRPDLDAVTSLFRNPDNTAGQSPGQSGSCLRMRSVAGLPGGYL